MLPLVRLVGDNVHSPQLSGRRVAELTIGPEAVPEGRYCSNGKAVRSSGLSYDHAVQCGLWVSSAEMTGLPVELIVPQRTSPVPSQRRLA